MNNAATAPDTIVLIHGLWMTPRSWEQWVPYYEAKGYRVITPTYPGFEIEVEALRENPEIIAKLTVPEAVDHIAAQIEALEKPPIIMGHSFGGTLTQLLVARGLGAAAVVIDSAPTEGVRVTPPSQLRSLFPILSHPSTFHGAFGYTPEQFHYTFTNTLSRDESDAVYNRYHIPAPGNWVWAYGLIANFKPGHQETWVDYSLERRAPLLFIAGGADHIMPASVNRSNADHYSKSAARTDFHEFAGRSHWTCGEPGWEAVADYALEWAEENATTSHISENA
jgi:pimeloyl-ACP methyl ester carboxylesterase